MVRDGKESERGKRREKGRGRNGQEEKSEVKEEKVGC